MAYVAVRGGDQAIESSLEQLAEQRKQDLTGMRSLIDQVMSEGSLYDEEIAYTALLQAEGSPEEAVFLIRAHRSTLIRKGYSHVVDTSRMAV
ncbi:MAG: carbon-phosphorus lyase, partial [Spirochaetaceae bacterium]